jgi:group I intron endonuclease
MYVYLLTNKINGKYYVGKTSNKNLNSYLSKKRWDARYRPDMSIPVIRAMAKYGVDNFLVDILAIPITIEELNILERIWIIILDSRNPLFGYNVWPGGDIGRLGIPCSEEAKLKIGIANKGRKPVGYVRTELHRKQLRNRMLGNKIGIKITPEIAAVWKAKETPEQRKLRTEKAINACHRARKIGRYKEKEAQNS